MTKRTFIVLLGVAMVAVLATGGLIASNMGFKLNYLLEGTGAGSQTGTNTIALPFNAQTGLNNVGDLGNDIGGFPTPVQNVQTFLRSSDSFNVYQGAKGQVADALVPGAGYLVKMDTNVNYIVAGSHDPALGVDLYATGDATPEGISQTGTNVFAVPYHTTAANVGDLGNDIGGFPTPVQNIQTFLRASDSFNVYQGAKGQVADALTPGTAVFIKMDATVNYIPSHY